MLQRKNVTCLDMRSMMVLRNGQFLTVSVTCFCYRLQTFWEMVHVGEGGRLGGQQHLTEWIQHTHHKEHEDVFQCHKQNYCLLYLKLLRRHKKNTERAQKSARNGMCYSYFEVFFFFFAKILNAAQTHKSKRLTRSPNTLVQLKPYSLLQSKFSITFQSSQEDHRNSCIKFINSILVRQ